MVDLSGVLPGWRGTDPDGGTWVLTHADGGDVLPWSHTTSDGEHHWRTQEEAEAAGLVAVVAETKVNEVRAEGYRSGWSDAAAPDATIRDEAVSLLYWLAEQLGEHVDAAYDRGETFVDMVKRLVAQVSAPAPLDPGNPEHRDAVADFLSPVANEVNGSAFHHVRETQGVLRSGAVTLRHKIAAAEQDAADRKRADGEAQQGYEAWRAVNDPDGSAWESLMPKTRQLFVGGVLAGIRAVRAERQEVGQ